GIPGNWSVSYQPATDGVAWEGASVSGANQEDVADAVLARQIEERNAGLSKADPQSVASMTNIAHTAPAKDAAGGDLTWAGGDLEENAPLPGQRQLNAEYVGEDQRSAAFAHDTMRGKLDDTNKQWTTEYDSSETDSVAARQVVE